MAVITNGEESSKRWSEILRPGLRAVKRNWAPFLLIQAIAAVLVISYYHFDAVRHFARSISELKRDGGILYVVVSGALAGGVFPQVAKIITGKVRRLDKAFWADTFYVGFVFAVLAVMVNTFYQIQTFLFGSNHDIVTLVKKMLLDMLVVSPILFVPTGMYLLHARRVGFRADRLRAALSWSFYRAYVIPTMPANLAFWVPMVLLVYALPTDLQFPFAQLAEAAWSLLFVFIAGEAVHV